MITADCPPGKLIPTHAHSGTHETFYILEGKVRLFFEDDAGTQTDELLVPGDFAFVPAGTPHAYRVEEAARRHRHDDRRLRAILPAHGHAHRPRHHAAAPVHPGLPAHAGGRAAARHAVHARLPVADGGASTRDHAAPPGLVRPDTDPLPDPVALDGGLGHLRRAVAYSAPPGFRPLELDLDTPAGPPAPVILFVHGGGWRMGTPRGVRPHLRDWRPGPFHRLVAAGFAVASIDYRLSAEAVFPAQLDDVRAAAGFLGARADELGVDATRVVAWGESAGAHLAALLGLTEPPPRSRASSTGTAPPT